MKASYSVLHKTFILRKVPHLLIKADPPPHTKNKIQQKRTQEIHFTTPSYQTQIKLSTPFTKLSSKNHPNPQKPYNQANFQNKNHQTHSKSVHTYHKPN